MKPADEDHLEQLNKALLSIPEEIPSMVLSEFDGFCAGVVVCSEPIEPKEWIDIVLGAASQDTLSRIKNLENIKSILIVHCNWVGSTLQAPGRFSPVFAIGRNDGRVIWEYWMIGLIKAMRLRPNSWNSIQENGDVDAKEAIELIGQLGSSAVAFLEGNGREDHDLGTYATVIIPEVMDTLSSFSRSQE